MSVDHIAYGMHSGIPKCCCEFWVNIKNNELWESEEFKRSASMHWGYVPCADCIEKNNRATIHFCTHECYDDIRSCGYSNRQAIDIVVSSILDGRAPWAGIYLTDLSYRWQKNPPG